MGVPQIIHFYGIFHEITHPFWGIPPLMETPTYVSLEGRPKWHAPHLHNLHGLYRSFLGP